MARADRLIARLADRQHGRVATRQLVDLGVSRSAVKRRIADGRLRPVHRGVHAVGHRQGTRRGRWMAAVLALGPDALLGNRDAAALWDVRPAGDRARVEVLVPGGSRRRHPGIAVHRATGLEPEDRALIDGIPVTSLPRTLLDLAATLDGTQLQRAYERAERLRELDVGAVRRLLARSNGHRGTGVLRALLEYDPAAAARADSELERLFLDIVRRAGLPTPLVNTLVCGYVVDAYWPRARLVVELQGYEFHSDRATFERDHAKLAALRRNGIELLPLTHRQVTQEETALAALLAQLLAERSGAARSSRSTTPR